VAHFFATADDLIPVFEQVEAMRLLQYARCGNFETPRIHFFFSGALLPSLGERLAHESAIAGPRYLISERGAHVTVRKISLNSGGEHFAIDQLMNEDTTVLWHGGIYKEGVLLYGRVDTASKTKGALQLQRSFTNAIRKHFKRVRAFWVGPNAERLLDLGWRLTAAEQCPPELDLKRE
jgi:hypothetical protein